MSVHDVVLEEKRRYYPFLTADIAFRSHDDEFCPELLHRLIGDYLARHIRKDVAKKGGSAAETLESLIKKIGEGCDGKDIFGTGSNLSAIVENLKRGDSVELPIGLANVKIGLKRFGNCIGIRVCDDRGDIHKSATEIFEQMATSCRANGGSDYLGTFVFSRSVVMLRWQAYGRDQIDVAAELASAARYVPDVAWRTDAGVVAEALFGDYISTDHQHGSPDCCGVKVGQYHDIPIYAQILFGEKESNKAWRRGSIEHDGTVLTFDSNSSGKLCIRYFVRSVDENNLFKKAESGVDYDQEQRCHHWLAEVLLNAFSARDLAETIARNPHWVAWRRKPAESAQA